MKSVIKSDQAPQPIGPYSQAIQAGNFLFVSGQIAINPATNELIFDGVEAETRQVMDNLSAVMNEAGYGFSDVVKATIFLKTMDDFPKVNEIYGDYFSGEYPARETVAVAGLPKGVNVEISLTAYKAQ